MRHVPVSLRGAAEPGLAERLNPNVHPFESPVSHSSLRTPTALAGVLLLVACTSAPAARSADRTSRAPLASADAIAIRQARAAQNRAIAAGDLDRAAAAWTEDVSLRRGLGQLLTGREAYRALVQAGQGSDSSIVYQREPTDVETSLVWPLAFETGEWAGHLGTISGPVVIGGRYSAQWVKRGGAWLIRSEVFVALTCAGSGCRFVAEP